MLEYEPPPELTDENVQPFLELLRTSVPEEFEKLGESPGLREHYADRMARSVWGFAYRAYWDGTAFRALMSMTERRALAQRCRKDAKSMRAALASGLIDQQILMHPFVTNALDRLIDLRGDDKDLPHYLSMLEGDERSFVVGTAVARECLARKTSTAVWPSVERRYLVQPSHAERAQKLADDAARLAGELEGRAILLEAIAHVLPPAKGSQDTGARYMFATCRNGYAGEHGRVWGTASFVRSCVGGGDCT